MGHPGDCVKLRGFGAVWGPHPKDHQCQAKELRPLSTGAGDPRVVLEQGRGMARARGPQG